MRHATCKQAELYQSASKALTVVTASLWLAPIALKALNHLCRKEEETYCCLEVGIWRPMIIHVVGSNLIRVSGRGAYFFRSINTFLLLP